MPTAGQGPGTELERYRMREEARQMWMDLVRQLPPSVLDGLGGLDACLDALKSAKVRDTPFSAATIDFAATPLLTAIWSAIAAEHHSQYRGDSR